MILFGPRGSRSIGAVLIALAVGAAPALGFAPKLDHGFVSAGVAFARPLDTDLADLYGSGFSPHVALGYVLSPRNRLDARVELWTRTKGLTTPIYAGDAEGRLRLVPISLRTEFALPRVDATQPFVVVGAVALRSEETFHYELLGDAADRSATRWDFGGILGVGVRHRSGRYTIRAALEATVTGGAREVLRGSGRHDAGNDEDRPSLLTLGLGLSTR